VVPAEKMAAFLNEMKTVRLRKVSSGDSLAASSYSRRRTSDASDHSFSHANQSLPTGGIAGRIQSLYSNQSASASTSALHRRPTNTPAEGPFDFEARTGEKRKRLDSLSSSLHREPGMFTLLEQVINVVIHLTQDLSAREDLMVQGSQVLLRLMLLDQKVIGHL
jgi:hypothetical protein